MQVGYCVIGNSTFSMGKGSFLTSEELQNIYLTLNEGVFFPNPLFTCISSIFKNQILINL